MSHLALQIDFLTQIDQDDHEILLLLTNADEANLFELCFTLKKAAGVAS